MSLQINFADLFEFTRAYLAGFYTFVAVFYTVRIILLKRSITREVVFAGSHFGSTWWNHITFRFFRVVIWMVCVSRLFFPSLDEYLGLFSSLQNTWLILIGNAFLALGLISIMTIHYRLGVYWRSGVDPSGPDKIISNGVYRYSRNPMFLLVGFTQVGFFLALPSVFSLLCLIIGLYTLQRQVLAEEVHLSNKFSEEYADYCANVRRWL